MPSQSYEDYCKSLVEAFVKANPSAKQHISTVYEYRYKSYIPIVARIRKRLEELGIAKESEITLEAFLKRKRAS
jgi:hypothetical protein